MMRRRSDLPPVVPQPCSSLVPADSFYARLAQWRDVLVDDEDYAPLYKGSPRGPPSIPPSLVVLAMLLQYHDGCSDAETEARVRFDLRWKHALGLPLQDQGFDSTVLCHFRRKLMEHALERALFERLVNAAREARLIAKDAAQLLDSSHVVLGAAGARDTYALIRGGIRKLLRALWGTRPRRGGRPSLEIGFGGIWIRKRPRSPTTSTGATPRSAPSTSRRSSRTPGRHSHCPIRTTPPP